MAHEYEYTGKAMGTEFSIAIVTDSKDFADKLAQNAKEKISVYEARFSRFLPESELSLLNIHKRSVVSDSFLEVACEAHRLFTITKGIFNPLVQIERFGYDKSFTNGMAVHEYATDDSYDIDFSTTQIDTSSHTIALHEGQKLDFGGFLKGFLATRLCKQIMNGEGTVTGAIVNIGGDLHTEGLDEKNKKFIFAIYNPIAKTEIFVPLFNTSLATSGIYKRTWNLSGKKLHHILDSSGMKNPESNIVSASVIHKNGGEAEAYAKVLLSTGPAVACTILNNQSLQYIAITREGAVLQQLI